MSAPGHSANRGLLASVSTVGVTSDTRFTLGTPAGANSVNVDLYQGTQGGGNGEGKYIKERGIGNGSPKCLCQGVA